MVFRVYSSRKQMNAMNKTTQIESSSPQSNSGTVISNLSFQKRSFRYFVAVIPFALVLLISTSYQQNPNDLNYLEQDYFSPCMVDSLRNFLLSNTNNNPEIVPGAYTLNRDFLRGFYFRNGYRPVWIRFNGLSERASDLIFLIDHAHEYGLEPGNYHIDAIRKLEKHLNPDIKKGNESENLKLEILLTDAAFRLMINLHSGYQAFDSTLYASDWINRFPQVLIQGISNNRVMEHILSVEPMFAEYRNLRMASGNFVRNHTLNDQSFQIQYPNKDSVMLYGEIKQALVALGYMQNTEQDIESVLKVFQKFHGLNPDGKPGANTVEALGYSSNYRYRMLALNLDRLRKKQQFEATLLYVNIPAYQLRVYHSNNLQDTFRVIVGNPKTPTPLLTGNMQRIIANPVWFVPKKIAINEILPKLKSDSNYLVRNGFKVLDENHRVIDAKDMDMVNMSDGKFNYTFRQSRGSDNSLGQVKFIFSNPYSVYLHDTPGKSLFRKDLRAFSHGCVRVQNPEKLAAYILANVNSDTTNFARLIKTGRQKEFAINAPLFIHITYITCEGDGKGNIYFYKDIYGKDENELKALASMMGI